METVTLYFNFNKTSVEYAWFLLEVYRYSPDANIQDSLFNKGNRNRMTVSVQVESEIATLIKLKYSEYSVQSPFGDEFKNIEKKQMNDWIISNIDNKYENNLRFDFFKEKEHYLDLIKMGNVPLKIIDFE